MGGTCGVAAGAGGGAAGGAGSCANKVEAAMARLAIRARKRVGFFLMLNLLREWRRELSGQSPLGSGFRPSFSCYSRNLTSVTSLCRGSKCRYALAKTLRPIGKTMKAAVA